MYDPELPPREVFSQPANVQSPHRCGVARYERMRHDVAPDGRHTSNHGTHPNHNALVDGHVSAHGGVVLEHHVSAQTRAVADYAAVADDCVVTDVGAAHEQHTIANGSYPAPELRSPLHPAVLADDGVIADLYTRGTALVLSILRRISHNRIVKNCRARSDADPVCHHCASADYDARAHHHVVT
eukprot:CAMPEP_0198732162 /NCGR_PEP_ID=MMETSP1475-20131203/34203_1 /TAXON_ID= ORGANISM="Unidentified sp., Strain CCMP1999" /NCGR_SAMPLE_ID=MMETSP1475 /ASSEMBLY_ACC=CAM_ASM_001111 /LENGTH=183 /DNA_ID=CAMNT_0044495225 /DNA_START=306 /DNA_END=853 /DNA_ORIENTATION=+